MLDSLLYFILVFVSSWSDGKLGTSYVGSLGLCQSLESFIVLRENTSDLADIISVLLIAETLNYLKTYIEN